MSYQHQDWTPIVFRKREKEKTIENNQLKEKQKGDQISKKLLDNPEDFHHKQISKEVADAIRQKRIELKLTQLQLAQKINEKVNVVQEIENMKAVYNHIIINKIFRILGLSSKNISK